jgi:hypothetical protein
VAGGDEFDFRYDGAEYEVDKGEPGKDDQTTRSKVFSLNGGVTLAPVSAYGLGTVTRKSYPEPPDGFTTSPLVESMWVRWLAYKNGRELLSSMAWAVFTTVRAEYGNEKQMAEVLGISGNALAYLRYLSSCVGTAETARKAPIKDRREHTGEEEAWMRRVVLAIIQRTGEVAAGQSNMPQLTETDS